MLSLWCLLLLPGLAAAFVLISPPPGRTATLALASRIDTSFDRRGNTIDFGAELTIDEIIRSVDVAGLGAFVEDPVNLISAAWPRELIERRPGGVYRLAQEPVDFAGLLRIDFSVDVAVVTEKSSTGDRIMIESRGVESYATFPDRPFGPPVKQPVKVNLDLSGSLAPIATATGGRDARVQGRVQYMASGALVGPLIFAPTPVLSVATDAINRGVMDYARREFVAGVESSFRRWWTPQQQEKLAAQRATLSRE